MRVVVYHLIVICAIVTGMIATRCTLTPDQGQFACVDAMECPKGWACMNGHCYSDASQTTESEPPYPPGTDSDPPSESGTGPASTDDTTTETSTVSSDPMDTSTDTATIADIPPDSDTVSIQDTASATGPETDSPGGTETHSATGTDTASDTKDSSITDTDTQSDTVSESSWDTSTSIDAGIDSDTATITDTDCECLPNSGPCCRPDCRFYTIEDAQICQTVVEHRCKQGDKCGSKGESRTLTAYCIGETSECTGLLDDSASWITESDCSRTERCMTDGGALPVCMPDTEC